MKGIHRGWLGEDKLAIFGAETAHPVGASIWVGVEWGGIARKEVSKVLMEGCWEQLKGILGQQMRVEQGQVPSL